MDNAGANNLLYQDRPTYTSLLLSPEHVLWLVVLEWSIDFKHILKHRIRASHQYTSRLTFTWITKRATTGVFYHKFWDNGKRVVEYIYISHVVEYVHICTHKHKHIYMCIYVYIYICIYIYIYIHIHVYVCIHIYIHTYTYICIYIYIHVHTQVKNSIVQLSALCHSDAHVYVCMIPCVCACWCQCVCVCVWTTHLQWTPSSGRSCITITTSSVGINNRITHAHFWIWWKSNSSLFCLCLTPWTRDHKSASNSLAETSGVRSLIFRE